MRVLVVGGGVAGPAVALAATRLGIEATVLERRAVADPDEGSWITVAPNGLDALEDLGVLDEARAVGHPSRVNRMFGATGRHLGDVTLGVPLDDGTVALTMKRSALAALLADAAWRHGADVRLGAGSSSVEDDGRGVRAVLADGSVSRATCWSGADGVRSRVRRAIDPAAPDARYVGLTNFGGITPRDPLGAGLSPEAWHFVFGRRSFFGAHPLPTGDVVWFANVPRAEISRAERAATTEEQWLAWLAELVSDDAGPASELVAAGRLELAGDSTFDLRTCRRGGVDDGPRRGCGPCAVAEQRPGRGDGPGGCRRPRPVAWQAPAPSGLAAYESPGVSGSRRWCARARAAAVPRSRAASGGSSWRRCSAALPRRGWRPGRRASITAHRLGPDPGGPAGGLTRPRGRRSRAARPASPRMSG